MTVADEIAVAALKLACLRLAIEATPTDLAPHGGTTPYDPYVQAQAYWDWATAVSPEAVHHSREEDHRVV